MSAKLTYTCNICPTERQESNHWFLLHIDKVNGALRLMPWAGFNPESADVQHLCGQACVIQAVQKWMGVQQGQSAAKVETEKTRLLEDAEFKQSVDLRNKLIAADPRYTPQPEPPSFYHRPQCAMICSDGADKCDCLQWQTGDPVEPSRIESPQRTRYTGPHAPTCGFPKSEAFGCNCGVL